MPPVLSIKTAVAKPIHRNEPTRLRVNLFSPGPAATRLRRQAMPGRRARDAARPEDIAPQLAALWKTQRLSPTVSAITAPSANSRRGPYGSNVGVAAQQDLDGKRPRVAPWFLRLHVLRQNLRHGEIAR